MKQLRLHELLKKQLRLHARLKRSNVGRLKRSKVGQLGGGNRLRKLRERAKARDPGQNTGMTGKQR